MPCSHTAAVRAFNLLGGDSPVWCCVLVSPVQEASVRGQLHMHTFRRLNLGIVLQTGATMVVAAQAVSLRNPLLTGVLRTAVWAVVVDALGCWRLALSISS